MKVSDDVLAVLSSAQLIGNTVLLTGQFDRALYTKTNKVLEAAGGKWSRKEKAHVFGMEAADRIDQIILSGSIEIPKDEFNFFPSPPPVVTRLIDLAGIEDGMRVLEPSAGQGAIAHACARQGAVVDCYELMEANFKHLQAYFEDVVHADFLEVCPEPIYDRVVMNPPFQNQSDIKHVTHALKFLKPGGLLVAVMSAGVAFRTDKRTAEFLALVKSQGGEIHQLPENSFKASGTGVNTVIAVIPA